MMSNVKKTARRPDYTRWLRALVASLALLTMGQSTVSSGAGVKVRNGKKPAQPGRIVGDELPDTIATSEFHRSKTSVRPLRASARRMLRIKGAALQSRMEDGQMIVTGLNGELAGGDVRMSGRINTSQPHGPQSARLEMRGVDIQEVLDLLEIKQDGISAPVSGVLDLRWQGLEAAPVRRTVSGNIALTLGGGKVGESRMLAKLREVSGISDLDELVFENGEIRGVVHDGKIEITSMKLNGADFRISAKGDLGLGDGGIDIAVGIDVSDDVARKSKYYKVAGVLGMFAREKALRITPDGLVEVPRFSVVGKLPKPIVKWQEASAAAQAEAEPAQTKPATETAQAPPAQSDTETPSISKMRKFALAWQKSHPINGGGGPQTPAQGGQRKN